MQQLNKNEIEMVSGGMKWKAPDSPQMLLIGVVPYPGAAVVAKISFGAILFIDIPASAGLSN